MRLPVVALVTAAALGATAAPAAAQIPIQPGAAISSQGTGCTLAWIFDGTPLTPQAGRVYGATAAHCVAGVGAPVDIRPAESGGSGGERIGTVAFRGDAAADGRDFAFIEIEGEDHGQVDPRMKGHPSIPTGLPANPQKGDTIRFSGYGTGLANHRTTREDRTGILNWLGEAEHQVVGVVAPGDSGGPVADVTDGGTALGIVNTLGAFVNTGAMVVAAAGENGANLRFVLADAGSRGFHVRLRTASGQNVGLEDE